MAGSITIGKGASPGYYTRQASRATGHYAAGAGQEKPGSEPAGVWTGDGCSDLGLQSDAEVDHEAFGYVFGSHIDPRDGSRIGRAMSHRDAEAIDGGMLTAEPSATAQRKDELWIQAQAQADKSRSVPFFDATFSVSKSITLLHASARAMKLTSEKVGDTAAAAQAQALEDTVWGAIAVGLRPVWRTCRSTPGARAPARAGCGRKTPHGWVVASWRQHTSRRGDPQLHIHNTILTRPAPSGTAACGHSTGGRSTRNAQRQMRGKLPAAKAQSTA